MSLQTGDDIWSQKLAEPAAGMLPAGDRLYVGGRDNQFHSLHSKDGDEDWSFKRIGADVLGLPVLDERRVYFIALDNVLRGHSRSGGAMIWKRVLPMRPFTGPLLSGETLIATGVAAELHAFNSKTGEPVEKPFVLKGAENEEVLLAAPPHLTADDLLILVTRGGQVRAVGSGAASDAPNAPVAPVAPNAPTAPDAPSPGAVGTTK